MARTGSDKGDRPRRRIGSKWWTALLGAVVVLVLIQFVPYRVGHRSARDEPKWDSPRTRTLVMRACGDCHSNQTKLLWFEQVAPITWYIANHVKEGRAALNFDEWHTAPGDGASEAGEAVSEGSMPPSYYTYFGLHGDSKLSRAQMKDLIDGLERTATADPPRGG
jgi:hypothetical protein